MQFFDRQPRPRSGDCGFLPPSGDDASVLSMPSDLTPARHRTESVSAAATDAKEAAEYRSPFDEFGRNGCAPVNPSVTIDYSVR